MDTIERLKHLRDVVVPAAVATPMFDMEYYRHDLKTGEALWGGGELVNCNTTFCIAGWAALDPTFNAEGLKWEKNKDNVWDIVYGLKDGPETSVKEFFGLNGYRQFTRIFMPHSYYEASGNEEEDQAPEAWNKTVNGHVLLQPPIEEIVKRINMVILENGGTI